MPTPNQSETPRTDAEEFVAKEEAYDCSTMVVSVDFARELERENNRLNKELEAHTKAKELVHKSFGFVPHPDGSKKCYCAYCRRDGEILAEYAGNLELEKYWAEEQLDALKAELNEARETNERLNRLNQRLESNIKQNDLYSMGISHGLYLREEEIEKRVVQRLNHTKSRAIRELNQWQACAGKLYNVLKESDLEEKHSGTSEDRELGRVGWLYPDHAVVTLSYKDFKHAIAEFEKLKEGK